MLTGSVASPGCPICASAAVFTHEHPDADIFRCPSCTHRFSKKFVLRPKKATMRNTLLRHTEITSSIPTPRFTSRLRLTSTWRDRRSR